MRGPCYLELGTELVAHQLMGGIVGKRNAHGVADPLACLSVGGKARGLLQDLLQVRNLVELQGRGFARWNGKFKQGIHAALSIALKPTPNCVAVDAQQACDICTEASLAAGEQIKRMEALLLERVALVGEQLFECSSRLMDDGNGFIHQVRARVAQPRFQMPSRVPE